MNVNDFQKLRLSKKTVFLSPLFNFCALTRIEGTSKIEKSISSGRPSLCIKKTEGGYHG
jgi:hypothetical protein